MEILVDILPNDNYNECKDVGRPMSYVLSGERRSRRTKVKEPRLAQSVAEEVRSLIMRDRMTAGDKLPTARMVLFHDFESVILNL